MLNFDFLLKNFQFPWLSLKIGEQSIFPDFLVTGKRFFIFPDFSSFPNLSEHCKGTYTKFGTWSINFNILIKRLYIYFQRQSLLWLVSFQVIFWWQRQDGKETNIFAFTVAEGENWRIIKKFINLHCMLKVVASFSMAVTFCPNDIYPYFLHSP